MRVPNYPNDVHEKVRNDRTQSAARSALLAHRRYGARYCGIIAQQDAFSVACVGKHGAYRAGLLMIPPSSISITAKSKLVRRL